MGILDFFKRKSPSGGKTIESEDEKTIREVPQPNVPSALTDEDDFIDVLIRFFKSQPEVTGAYFGLLQNAQTNKSHLFLAVDHNGDENFIMQHTWGIKTQFMPSTELYYASKLTDNNLFEAVKRSNFAFYSTEESTIDLQVLLVRHFFSPEKYGESLIDAIKHGQLISLFIDFNASSNVLHFQSFMRPSGEFVAIFSSREMIAMSGMVEVPKNLTVLQFDYQKIDELINFKENKQLFVLNPGTTFEFEFFA